ncbi:MAG: hypothetical protein ACYDAG_07485 [Chloroflexota bacterium]
MALSGFLSKVGVHRLLIVWIIDDILVLGEAGIQTLIVDRFNRVALIRWVSLAFAFALVGDRLLFLVGAPNWLGYSLLYGISEQQFLFFPLVFWVLAEDGVGQSQQKRLFPLIGSMGFIGRLVGIALSGISPIVLHAIGADPADVLFAGAGLYMVAWLVLELRLRKLPLRKTVSRHHPPREVLTGGFDFIRRVPAFGYLTLAVLAVVACNLLLEFRFYVVSDAAFPSTAAYQEFFSLYRLGLALVGVLVETFVVSRLVTKIGMKNAFLILPTMALLGALFVAAIPGQMFSVLTGMVLLKLPQSTVDENVRKEYLTFVPEERRGRVSLLLDSYVYGIGDILGCLAAGAGVLLAIFFAEPRFAYLYLGLAVAAGALALWSIIRMRRVYDASLLNWRLKRRQRSSDLLDRLV